MTSTLLFQFFQQNPQIVLFTYGLSVFSLGLVITIQPRRLSRYTLAKSLGSLAGFAFLHAFADWGGIFIPLHALPGDSQWLTTLWGIKTLAVALSFVLLFHFGLSLVLAQRKGGSDAPLSTALPGGTFGLWLLAYIIYPYVVGNESVVQWFFAAEVWARYLLGFPGAMMTAWGLVLQAGELRRDGLHSHVRSLFAVAAFFVGYAVAAGLVVPQHGFFPAHLVNSQAFMRLLGIPVELVRALTMLGVAFFMYRLVDIFNVETTRRLFRAEEEQAVLRERERIARDLHDGIMQTLYGVGLGLKRARANPQLVDEIAQGLTAAVNQAIMDLRSYVSGLRRAEWTGADLVTRVQELLIPAGQFAGLRIELQVEGFEPADGGSANLPADLCQHTLAVLRESLSNVVRHAGVGSVRVVLAWQDDTVVLRVADAGRGFLPGGQSPGVSTGFGLENMRQRVAQMGGVFHVTSAPGEGTEVLVQVPLPRAPRDPAGTEAEGYP